MKSKKWIIITVISFVLIAASIVLLFVWILPSMNKNKALKAIADGDEEQVGLLFKDKSIEERESLKEDVKDIVVYTANQYIDGQKSYEDMFRVMKTVEDISPYEGLTADAFMRINVPKMVETYQAALKAYGENGDNDQYKSKLKEFDDYRDVEFNNSMSLKYGWDGTQVDAYDLAYETALDAELKKKYEEYSAGKIEYSEIKAASDVATTMWYSDYAYNISNELYYDDYFRGRFEELQKEYDEKEYLDVINGTEYFKETYSDEAAWPRWESKFEELNKKATEQAKIYYVQQAVEYANSGDSHEAENIMNKLKERFGDDVDVSPIEAAIQENSHADWQKAYVAFMADWQNNLANDIATASSNVYMTADLYDPDMITVAELDAKYVTLYDIDKNGIPEMFLRGTEYVVVYTYDNESVIYTGYMAPMGVGGKGEMIVGATEVVDGTEIIAEALIKFKNNEWTLSNAVAYAVMDGEYAYIIMTDDGGAERASEDEFKKGQEKIEGRMKGQLPAGVEMAKYEEYIYSYSE